MIGWEFCGHKGSVNVNMKFIILDSGECIPEDDNQSPNEGDISDLIQEGDEGEVNNEKDKIVLHSMNNNNINNRKTSYIHIHNYHSILSITAISLVMGITMTSIIIIIIMTIYKLKNGKIEHVITKFPKKIPSVYIHKSSELYKHNSKIDYGNFI